MARSASNVVKLPERKREPNLWHTLRVMVNGFGSRRRLQQQRPNPFSPAAPFPGVVGEGQKPIRPQLAMDAADAWQKMAIDQDVDLGTVGASWLGAGVTASNYAWSAYAEGQDWLGYAILALMFQRAEYRIMVETVATEMTREWITFKSKSDDKNQQSRIEKIENRLRELRFQHVMKSANINDGSQGRGQIYIDVGDPDDRDELRSPLTPDAALKKYGGKKKFIQRLGPIEPMWCYPAAYEASDPLKADWYRPDLWWVMGKEVHRDRLLTFVGNPVADLLKPAYSFGGLALIQMAKPYVDFWLRNRTSESDLLQNFSMRCLGTEMDVSTSDEGSQLFQRAATINAFADNQGLLLYNKASEEFSIQQTSLGGVPEITRQSMERMTLPSRMPVVKFFGNQPSGLNADSEGVIRMWYDDIKAAQESRNREPIQRIVELVEIEEFGEVIDDITWNFNDLWQLDEAGKMAVQLTKAQIVETDISSGVIDPEEGRLARAKDEDSPYVGMDLEEREAPGEQLEERQQETGGVGGAGQGGPFAPKPQTTTSSKLARSVEGQAAGFGGPATGGLPANDGWDERFSDLAADIDTLVQDVFNEEDHPRGGNVANPGQFSKSEAASALSKQHQFVNKGMAKVAAAAGYEPHPTQPLTFVHPTTGATITGKPGGYWKSEHPEHRTKTGKSTAALAAKLQKPAPAGSAKGVELKPDPLWEEAIKGSYYSAQLNPEKDELAKGYIFTDKNGDKYDIILSAAGTGNWKIGKLSDQGWVYQHGQGQESLNAAFEALHPRGPGGKFKKKEDLGGPLKELGFEPKESMGIVSGYSMPGQSGGPVTPVTGVIPGGATIEFPLGEGQPWKLWVDGVATKGEGYENLLTTIGDHVAAAKSQTSGETGGAPEPVPYLATYIPDEVIAELHDQGWSYNEGKSDYEQAIFSNDDGQELYFYPETHAWSIFAANSAKIIAEGDDGPSLVNYLAAAKSKSAESAGSGAEPALHFYLGTDIPDEVSVGLYEHGWSYNENKSDEVGVAFNKNGQTLWFLPESHLWSVETEGGQVVAKGDDGPSLVEYLQGAAQPKTPEELLESHGFAQIAGAAGLTISQLKAEQAAKQPKPVPVASSIDLSYLSKQGEMLGTTPGGTYVDASGKKFYVKLQDEARSKNEMLAAALASAVGMKTFTYRLLDDGKGLASEWEDVDKAGTASMTPEELKKIQTNFATFAWLANWDVGGAGPEKPSLNMGIIGGEPVSLDWGGALLYRGAGKPKGDKFDTAVSEWDKLRDQHVNPTAHKLFGSMTGKELAASAEQVAGITDDAILSLVNQYGPGTTQERAALAEKLIKRRDAVVAKGKAAAAEAAKPKVEPKSSHPEHFAKPDFGKYHVPSEVAQKLMAAMPSIEGHKTAIKSYTGGGYKELNRRLRYGLETSGSVAKSLTGFLNKASFPEDRVVLRKVSNDYADFLRDLNEGDEFVDRGFMSTSIANDVWFGPVWMELRLTKGAKAAYVESVTASHGEYEVIIQRNSRIRVLGIEKKAGKHHMICEVDQSHLT